MREELREYVDDLKKIVEAGALPQFVSEAYQTKDSGKRAEFAGGMVRDISYGKTDYTYIFKGPMAQRWAELMERGAKKYERDNWMKASDVEALERFRQSALRHMVQWLNGETDEDHAAAVMFNLNGAEYVKQRITEEPAKILNRLQQTIERA